MTGSPSKPRILQVCAVDFTARHFLLPLMRAQRQAGFEVALACAPGEFTAGLMSEGYEVFPVPFQRSFNLPAHLVAYSRLLALLRRHHFSVVHAHTPIAAMIARWAAARARVPLVLYTAHGFYFHEAMRPAVRQAHIWLERTAQRRADFLFTQSAEDAQTAIQVGISPAGRTLAIGNGVDTARFAPEQVSPSERAALRREFGLTAESGPLVIMIGRLVREKGYFEFMQALGRLKADFPTMRALVVGDALKSDHDDSAAAIRAEAHAQGLDQTVIFAGLRPDVPQLLALADIFCLPSWREGMPRSLIEAMAAGLPVVATNIRGCREEVVDGHTGVLVPVRDAVGLAQGLRPLLADPALRRRMGEAGRQRAIEKFDEARVIERQMHVMKKLFADKQLAWPK
jgi:glycosyltransferase involved in cell wall biosynthesis